MYYSHEFQTSAAVSGHLTATQSKPPASFMPLNKKRGPHNFIWSNSEYLDSESYSSIIEGMNRVCPYSPEEKKQRIQRYRNKRNHRNFNKTIKYECRKTLADSRQRIRGRFARNDKEDDDDVHEEDEEEEEEDSEEKWTNFLQVFDFSQLNPIKLLL